MVIPKIQAPKTGHKRELSDKNFARQMRAVISDLNRGKYSLAKIRAAHLCRSRGVKTWFLLKSTYASWFEPIQVGNDHGKIMPREKEDLFNRFRSQILWFLAVPFYRNYVPNLARFSFLLRLQIGEILFNAMYHAQTDIFISARKITREKSGRIQRGVEVIIWNTGKGIPDLESALTRTHTTIPPSLRRKVGAGAGLGCNDNTVSKVIYESGRVRAESQGPAQFSSYTFSELPQSIIGTKVTLLQWDDAPVEVGLLPHEQLAACGIT